MHRGGRILAAVACVSFAILAGCQPTTRHKVLTVLFDGVPEPASKTQAAPTPGAAPVAVNASVFTEHGPYAAKLCNACHTPQTNVLVAPATELCYKCHQLQLTKKYIHGPLASGGCVVCHDPHSSPNRSLLVAESTTFCVRCHDTADIAANPAHQDTTRQCTECHDAHMSDKRYLLK